jgi:hypothetical protein
MGPADVLQCIVPKLEQGDIQYMITGSIAASYYGLARATYDLDIVISVTPEKLRSLIQLLPQEEYYAVLQDALDACRHQTMFNVLDTVRGWKIDFIVQKAAPFHCEAFQRRVAVTFAGVPVSLISAEDLVLSKLEWAKMGESERQVRDVAVVLEKCQLSLDLPYVEKWVCELGLASQWAEARRQAGIS